MNRLAFNPNKEIIEQWRDVYLDKQQIIKFESLIDKLYVYLDVVLTHKINFLQKERKREELISGSKNVILEGISIQNKDIDTNNYENFFSQHQEKDLSQLAKIIIGLKQNFMEQYDRILSQNKQLKKQDTQKQDFVLNLVAKYKDPLHYKKISNSKINFQQYFHTFQGYFSNLERDVLRAYMKYLSQNDSLIQKFVYFKIHTLRAKCAKFVDLKNAILKNQHKSDVSGLVAQSYSQIKTLFQNLFIQVHYLSKLVNYNLQILKQFEEETDKNNFLLQTIRTKHKQRMLILHEDVKQLKKQIRDIYISLYETTKAQRNDPKRLWKFISDQIAVNKEQFEQTSNTVTFTNGLFFAFLLTSLFDILVLISFKLLNLEQNKNYMAEFRIWRGASYLIFFNWILGIVFYLLDYFRINYRLLLIEVDTFVPKPQKFFFTATFLSAIYLILFFVYLLKVEDIIQGHDLMLHLSYFMWLINILFLINPFKILNYQGRRFFVKLILKVLVSPFRPTNKNIFFVTLIMGSFVQPFSDFSFTMCHLANDMRTDCIKQAKIATFIYTEVYVLIIIVQCIRFHSLLKIKKMFSRPRLGIIAALFSMNNVISSFVYNTYLYKGLLTYWIISAILATIAGINSDIRAIWGLISFDSEDCILRKTKTMPRSVYFAAMIADVILSVGWVFTVSNNLSFSDSVNPIYFLMILSYIELVRKGMWIFFKLEDDHSTNVGNLNALISDESIYASLRQKYRLEQKTAEKQNNATEEAVRQSAAVLNINQELEDVRQRDLKKAKTVTIEQVQEDISRLKVMREKMAGLEKQFADYLALMNKMYIRLDWQSYI